MFFRDSIYSGIWKFVFLPTRVRKISALVACICTSFVLIMLLMPDSRGEIIVSVLVGVLFAWILTTGRELLMLLGEDKRKISEDHNSLLKIYDQEYKKELELYGGTRMEFLYDSLFNNPSDEPLACRQQPEPPVGAVKSRDGRLRVEIDDHPERMFCLNNMLETHFLKIFQAHNGSFLRNYPTLRLSNFEQSAAADGRTVLRIETMRSTYFNHLVTNRAMDFIIDDMVSVRTLFEYGPLLVPLDRSQLSNHIGLNAIVYLSDGTMLFKQRNNTATISKGMLTSSIAAKIDLKEPEKKMTSYKLLMEPILDGLVTRLGIYDKQTSTPEKKKPLTLDKMDIYLLGVGRNVYEGGKPHLYFAVYMKELSLGDYLREYMAEYRKLMRTYKFDGDKMLYFCTPQTRAAKGGRLRISYHYYSAFRGKLREKLSERVLEVEKSFLCNYWHLRNNHALRRRLQQAILAWGERHPDQKIYVSKRDEPPVAEPGVKEPDPAKFS